MNEGAVGIPELNTRASLGGWLKSYYGQEKELGFTIKVFLLMALVLISFSPLTWIVVTQSSDYFPGASGSQGYLKDGKFASPKLARIMRLVSKYTCQ
jgi:hypothetical protein